MFVLLIGNYFTAKTNWGVPAGVIWALSRGGADYRHRNLLEAPLLPTLVSGTSAQDQGCKLMPELRRREL